MPFLCCLLSVVYCQYERALPAERQLCFRTTARVGMLRPRSPDTRRREHAGLVRCPTCAAGSYHPIRAVVLEDSWCFVVSCRRNSGVAAGVVQVIIRKFGDMKCEVLLRTEDVVSLAVVVDVKCHVARHLPCAEIAFHEQPFVYCLQPGWCPLLPEVGFVQRIDCDELLLPEFYRPSAGVGTLGIEETVWSFRAIGNGNSVASCIVAFPLQRSMSESFSSLTLNATPQLCQLSRSFEA